MLNKYTSTRFNFPYPVAELTDLPVTLFEMAKKVIKEEKQCNGIFVIPVQQYLGGEKQNIDSQQALICVDEDIYQIIEPGKRNPDGKINHISAQEIIQIKSTQILLYGKLEIFGENDGQMTSISVVYNTVAHQYLVKLLHHIIKKTWKWNQLGLTNPSPDESFEELFNISFSLYNGLKFEGLHPDEIILGYVFQDEIFEPWMKIFKRKVVSKTLMTITNQQLIILEENSAEGSKYGWLFTFTPLYRIENMGTVFEKNKFIINYKLKSSISRIINQEILLNQENNYKWQTTWENCFRKDVFEKM